MRAEAQFRAHHDRLRHETQRMRPAHGAEPVVPDPADLPEAFSTDYDPLRAGYPAAGAHSGFRPPPRREAARARTPSPPPMVDDPRQQRLREQQRRLDAKRRQYEMEAGVTFAPAISEKSLRIATALPTSAMDRLLAPKRAPVVRDPAVEEEAELTFIPRIDPRSSVLVDHKARREGDTSTLWARLSPSADATAWRDEDLARRKASAELLNCTFRPQLSAGAQAEKLRERLHSTHGNVDEYFAARRSAWERRQQAWEEKRAAALDAARASRDEREADACTFQPSRERSRSDFRAARGLDRAYNSRRQDANPHSHPGEREFLERISRGRQRREEKQQAMELRREATGEMRRSRSAGRPSLTQGYGFVSNFDKLQQQRQASNPPSRSSTPRKEIPFREIQASLREQLYSMDLG